MIPALLGAAFAGELVVSSLTLNADDGMHLSYTLSGDSWEGCEKAYRTTGLAPHLVVAWEAGGYSKTVHVELKEPSRSLQISGGTWPTGLSANVSLRNTQGGFDRLRVNGRSGSSVRVAVDGGTPGGSPIQQPQPVNTSNSSSSSSWSVQPAPQPAPAPRPVAAPQPQGPSEADIAAAAALAAEQARLARERAEREAAERRRQLEEQRRRAEEWRRHVAAVAADPSHPTTTLCREKYPGLDNCISNHLADPVGFDIARACEGFEKRGWQEECHDWGDRKRWPATIRACQEHFGTQVEGVRCLNYAQEAEWEASGDVAACRVFEDEGFALSCIKRLGENRFDATELVEACDALFDKEKLGCVNMGARGTAARPALARACREGVEKEAKAIQCMYEFKSWPGGDVGDAVVACNEVFPEERDRLKCYERARRDPVGDRIRACADVEEKKRLKCVGS